MPAADVIRTKCGGRSATLNINNRVSLTSVDSKASGMISNDDQTLALTQQVNIAWFKGCGVLERGLLVSEGMVCPQGGGPGWCDGTSTYCLRFYICILA